MRLCLTIEFFHTLPPLSEWKVNSEVEADSLETRVFSFLCATCNYIYILMCSSTG